MIEKLGTITGEFEALEAGLADPALLQDVGRYREAMQRYSELKAIVATNSLELGIDIGDLDEVVLIQTPRSVASAGQATRQIRGTAVENRRVIT